MKKTPVIIIISFIFFLLLLFWIGYYVKTHFQEFRDIRLLSLEDFLILLLFTLMYFGVQGMILKTIVEPFGVRLKFKEWFGIMMVTLMGNFLIPFGGFGFRAGYLKKVYSFDYTYFGSTLGAVCLIEFLIFTLGGIVSLIFLYFHAKIFNLTLAVLLAVILLICLIFLFFSPKMPDFKNKILWRIGNIIESWYSLKNNRELLQKLFGLTFLEFIFSAFIFYFAFRSFGFQISFTDAFLSACLSTYSLFIRLMPASFGFYEGAVVFSAKLLGFSLSQGLLVTAATRFSGILWVFTLGPIFSYILVRKQIKIRNS